MDVVLDARGLEKSFGPQIVLGGVQVTLHAGERAGLVGLNGTGKSTLGRILAGLDQPDGGQVARNREASFGYLSQSSEVPEGVRPGWTALDEVLDGLGAWSEASRRHEQSSAALAAADGGDLKRLLHEQSEAAAEVERLGGWDQSHRAREVLDYLKVRDPAARLETMSGGELRRVALARILVARPTLAILDEPTNHLDVETIEWLERYLADDYPGALLLITHDRYILDRVVQRTLELNEGRLHSYEGGYEAYLEAKARRMELEVRSEANRQRFLSHELEWLRRQPKARMGKQKARRSRAESALETEAPRSEHRASLQLEAGRSSKWLLELQGLRLDLGGRTLVNELDFVLMRGQRIGIMGPNGCGKTTLLRSILGQLEPTAGAIRLSQTAELTYLSQVRDDLDDERSILENIAGGGQHVAVGDRMMEVHTYLERFLFRGDDRLRQPVGSLSGGERTRVALAKVLQGSANLVILDEPTNDLDVSTLSALEQLLLEFGGTALVVTHDRWFLDRVATGLLVFEGEGRVVHHAGNYTLVRALRQQQAAEEPKPSPSQPSGAQSGPATPGGKRSPRKRSALTYGERLELEALESQVEQADRRVAELEARLADPSTYQVPGGGGGEATRIGAELEQARAEAARLMARWEELETKRESGQDGDS
jgi:ATP-binding cassette subfamily F protein uup